MSLMKPAVHFLLSSLTVNSKNLRADPQASLLVTAPTNGSRLQSGRATIIGAVVELTNDNTSSQVFHTIGQHYLAAHPESSQWISFADFSFYRLEPVDIYFVAGFGKMGWVSLGGAPQ